MGAIVGQTVDGHEVDLACLSTEHSKLVDLPSVVSLRALRIRVVCVRTGRSEFNAPLRKTPGLALNAFETLSIVDDEVVPRVLAKRH
jgi:hypothetical protein